MLATALADRYRLDRELGRGGFAVVYRAQDLRHDRPVALKVLHAEVTHSIGAERFEREIRLAARLQHPHILGVFDSGEIEGRLWFAMPFIDGEALRDRMAREHQLPIADAVSIAREVADALDYASTQGVVHRDVKPENILLSGRHAMVADFGIARALSPGAGSLTQTGMSIGTPGYMSPEQAMGEAVDVRSDVFALGCVLHEMLAGEPPFPGPNPQSVITRMLTEVPRAVNTTRSGVSESLALVVRRALEKTPADRYQSAREFGDALAAAMASPALETTAHAFTGARATTKSNRSRTAAFLAVPLVLVLVGAGVWRYAQRDSGAPRGMAVLPFESAGAGEDAVFADGVTEEVRGKLAAIPGLRVIARTSSSLYRASKLPLPDIGRELGVQYLLTGHIQIASDSSGQRKVRVTPELINVKDGGVTWQQQFDAVLSDVFTVQSHIATQVASALDIPLAAAIQNNLDSRPTQNIEAYREYLLGEKASTAMARADSKSLGEALPHYERAVALDSTFGLAWGRIALVRVMQFNANPEEQLARSAEDAAARAIRLAPNEPQARRANSRMLRSVKKDYAAALAQIDSGLSRSPNDAELLSNAASLAAILSHWDDAVTRAQRAYAIDPRNAYAAAQLAKTLHIVRRFADADVYYAKALELSPGNIATTEDRAINQISLGNLAGAKAVVAEALATADSTELASFFALFQEMQWVLDEPMLRRITRMTPANFFNNRQQWALKVGRTWLLLGDTARGRAYGDSSHIAAEAQLAKFPADAQLHELNGRALALMGRNAQAIEEATTSLKMRETALDASTGPYVRYQVARIFVQAGAADRALDMLEPLLEANFADVTPAWLSLEPVFRPLRGNPRFDRILAKVPRTLQ